MYCCCRMYDQFQGELQKAQLKSSDADIAKVKQVRRRRLTPGVLWYQAWCLLRVPP